MFLRREHIAKLLAADDDIFEQATINALVRIRDNSSTLSYRLMQVTGVSTMLDGSFYDVIPKVSTLRSNKVFNVMNMGKRRNRYRISWTDVSSTVFQAWSNGAS
jgi:hypothetical protein